MAAKTTLEIVLKAKDEASAKLKGINSSLQQHSAQLKRTGLAMTAAGAAGAFAIIKLTAAAGAATGIESAFTSFFGAEGPKALEAMKAATRGSVSEIDLMTAANQAMLLGIDPEALPEMFEGAFAAAAATGRPVAAAIGDITTGIGRQSKLILDNLGIIVNAGNANEVWAAKLGKSTDALTEQEKKAAFTAATMKALQINTERIGEVQDSAAIASERLKSAFKDASIVIGEAMAPAVIALSDKLKILVDKFKNLSPETLKTIGKIALLTTGFLLLVGPILTFIGFLPAIIAGFVAIKVGAIAAGIAIAGMTAATGPLIVAFGALLLILLKVRSAQAEVRDAWQKTFDSFEEGRKRMIANTDKLIRASENLTGEAQEASRLRIKASLIAEQVNNLSEKRATLVAQEASADRIASIDDEIAAQRRRGGEATRAAIEFEKVNVEAGEAVRDELARISDSAEEMNTDVGVAMGGAAGATEDLSDAARDLARDYGDAARDIAQNLSELEIEHKEKMSNMKDQIGDVLDAAFELGEEYTNTMRGIQSDIAGVIADQRELVEELEEKAGKISLEIAAEVDPEKMQRLKEDLADVQEQKTKEQKILDDFLAQKLTTEDEDAEVTRRRLLSANQRRLEDLKIHRDERETFFSEAIVQMDAEIEKIRETADAAQEAFTLKRDEMELTMTQILALKTGWETGMDSMQEITKERVDQMTDKLNQLKEVIVNLNTLMNRTQRLQRRTVVARGTARIGDLFREHGGPVSAENPFIVGEAGPELFVPRRDGRIIPNGGLGGGTTINLTITGNSFMGDEEAAIRVGDLIVNRLKLVSRIGL